MNRNVRLNLLAAVVGAAILGGMASQASAGIIYDISSGAVPLSNLLTGTGNSLLVGDKIFDNFTYSTTGSDMPPASAVNVTGETVVVNGVQTWGFQLSGAFQDTNTPGASDAILRYDVNVQSPSTEQIFGAAVLGDPDVIGTGNVQVTETWTPNIGSSKIRVYDIEPGSTTQLKDALDFSTPVTSLTVTKDILAFVANGSVGSAASITSIDQLYSQAPGVGTGTPEPASLGLLALGGLGLLARRRR